MTTVPCPRCGMPLELDEEICPHCRAPRDDMEMEEGRALVLKEKRRLEQRPKRIAAVLAVLILVVLAWCLRVPIIGSLRAAWSDFAAEVERTRDPRLHVSVEPTFAAPAPAPPALPDQVAVSSFVYLAGDPPAAAAQTTQPAQPGASSSTFALTPASTAQGPIVTAAPVPAAPIGPFRRFYGVLYDLETLKPVDGAKLQFKSRGSGIGQTVTTDVMGRYQIDFFKGGDHDLVVSADIPGYRPGLYEDKDPPLHEWTRDARRQVLEEMTDGDLDPVPVRFRESAELVQLDLIVVPPAVQSNAQ